MSDTITSAAKKIRLAIFDMDGVLTDGRLYLLDDGQNLKAFHCHDGLGIKLLAKTGISTAVITAHRSALIDKRMAQLQVDHVYQGVENIDATRVEPWEIEDLRERDRNRFHAIVTLLKDKSRMTGEHRTRR